MSELISGKEALIALANGEGLQQNVDGEWVDIRRDISWRAILGEQYKLRLKPRTITINGIEVPCCGKDYQYGDAMYILNSLEPEEYSLVVLDKADEVPAYWWKSEDEIKQVIAALRNIFGAKP